MNSIIKQGLVSSTIGALLFSVAPIALTFTPTSALAATTYTCESSITYKDSGGHTGIQSIGIPTKDTASTSAIAAETCHSATRAFFRMDAAWYNPSQVCANSQLKGPIITVWAIDRFISDPAGHYNRVDSYTVNCASATWDHSLQSGVSAF